MRFKHGEQLAGICFADDQVLKVGKHCDSIIVSMEQGQMASVPWFEVWIDGELVSKWSGAKCEGVLYTQRFSLGVRSTPLERLVRRKENVTEVRDCKKCNGTGSYMYDHNHSRVCDACCQHDKGWWELSEHYAGYLEGADNACCKAGCGTMRRDLGGFASPIFKRLVMRGSE